MLLPSRRHPRPQSYTLFDYYIHRKRFDIEESNFGAHTVHKCATFRLFSYHVTFNFEKENAELFKTAFGVIVEMRRECQRSISDLLRKLHTQVSENIKSRIF